MGSTAPSFAQVILVERIFASLRVLGYIYKDVLLRHKNTAVGCGGIWSSRRKVIKKQVHALWSLLYEYRPAIVALLVLVRDSNGS